MQSSASCPLRFVVAMEFREERRTDNARSSSWSCTTAARCPVCRRTSVSLSLKRPSSLARSVNSRSESWPNRSSSPWHRRSSPASPAAATVVM